MVGRGIFIAAVVLYGAVLLGSLFDSTAQSAPPRAKVQAAGRTTPTRAERAAVLPFRGAAMQLQRIDWTESEYRRSLDELHRLGFDTVLFVVDAHQEYANSTRIYLDMRLTPTPEQLGGLIDYAKKICKLRVILMPIVLLDKARSYTEWRGTIKPEEPADWWHSYRAMLHHYSWIAEAHKVDVLVVGSELVSMESKADEWKKTIEQVRREFKGMITYSSNWDHYKDIPFWDQLDLIGMNSYWELGRDHRAGVPEIQKRWADIQKNLSAFQQQVGKPLVLLEAGWCSLQNAAHEPWDYTRTEVPIDLDLQRRLYEGFFKSWYGVPWFGGFMIWEWPPGDGGFEHRGYTPEGKPAEKLLREWLAKPAWEVK